MTFRLVAVAALWILLSHSAAVWAAKPQPEEDDDEDEEEDVSDEMPAAPALTPPAAGVTAGEKPAVPPADSARTEGADKVSSGEEDAETPERGLSLSLSYYAMPQEPDFLTPVVAFDRGRLHLEARYNYEAQHTGSVFAGASFSGGDALSWSVTPIFGVVFGDYQGVAPGLEASLAWKDFDFYTESEYYIDHRSSRLHYFSAWNEIGWRPIAPLRIAMVTQRTRLLHLERDVQRGALLQWTLKRGATLGLNFFNPGSDRRFTIFSLSTQY
ncbi:hypothetical protein GCM10025771_09840 [Niveibacterium umoris]|uniref:YaiO family outer membrane beta-barrel protein n=1 Tax=Niveibacterium umoris TaxID=1193620 RepID=A0A840BSY4_9RHOO|nr:hypothetical protein [Niveibacterium umoris]MBB4013467.1 hypothetical protein [Niveibacterium umoris]